MKEMLYALAGINWVVAAVQLPFFPDPLNVMAFALCITSGVLCSRQARATGRA